MAGREGSSHTGGDSVVEALERLGVEVVFGIPSVHNIPIYDALARRGSIKVVTVRHEQAAAGAADAYARVSGRLGAFITSTGPGAANAMGGLLEAFVSGSPVLHLTGQIDSRFLGQKRGFIHEVPAQGEMLGSLSKRVLTAATAESIFGLVLEAAGEALTSPRGPVSVELPIDLQYAETGPSEGSFIPPEPSVGFGREELARAVELLSAARRPLIWAGGGVVSAEADRELRELAERLGAGVITTPNARGVLPEDHPLCIGNLPWDAEVRRLAIASDLLVAVGTRYQATNTDLWRMKLPAGILQIDVRPEVPARNYPPALALEGDARLVLAELLEDLPARSGSDAQWRREVAAVAQSARRALRATLGPQEALLDETAAALDDESVVVKDSTIPAYTWGNRLLPVRAPRRSIMPNGFAIGLGLTHALGAAVASRRPVLLMAGDGGFMLAATELATIAQEELPVVAVVFNDGGYGILRNIQERQYGRRIGVDLGRPDFVGLAASLGVKAERVASADSYGKALRGALEAGRPHLIELDLAAIGPMAVTYTGTSRPPVEPVR